MNKLEQLHLDAIEKSHYGYGYSNDDKMQAASKSAQITENIAIEFAEWVDGLGYTNTENCKWGSLGVWKSFNDESGKTLKELFDIFLNEKQ